ncbi:hypothetical protein MASR1M46_16330 [Bacteroidales bacterium]
MERLIKRALKGEIVTSESDKYIRQDGSESGRLKCRPWHDEDGAIGGIIVYTAMTPLNIHDKLSKSRRSQKMADDWNKTFQAMQDGVALLDDKHHIIQANNAFYSAIGSNNLDFFKSESSCRQK